MASAIKKAVLAYSGGLDTSVIIPWLRETYGCEIIAMVADLGQGDDELIGIEEKAKNSGASECYVVDLRREFIEGYIWPTLKAGAIYERKYLLGTSFARPIIAKAQVDIARKTGADAVSHGATGKGNDQVRFETTYAALAPDLKVVACWREPEWTMTSREEALDYAALHNVPVVQSRKSIYSRDRNLWHLSHEGGPLEDPMNEPPKDMFVLTVDPEDAPDEPTYVEVGFKQGVPVSVDGKQLGPVEIIEALNDVGAKNGVGRTDMVENRLVGMKSRGVYETPGGTIIYAAHRELESLVLDRDTMHYKDVIAERYADLVYNGKWFSPLREAIDAFVDSTQQHVEGFVRMKLYKGNCTVAGVRSEYSLYSESLAAFTTGTYDHNDATGFMHLWTLPEKTAALLRDADEK
jgi:argininosuccinate synthase